jgi:hypothetical protein
MGKAENRMHLRLKLILEKIECIGKELFKINDEIIVYMWTSGNINPCFQVRIYYNEFPIFFIEHTGFWNIDPIYLSYNNVFRNDVNFNVYKWKFYEILLNIEKYIDNKILKAKNKLNEL